MSASTHNDDDHASLIVEIAENTTQPGEIAAAEEHKRAQSQPWPTVSNLLNYWYPVAFVNKLTDNKPIAVQLYGEPLVIFRGATSDEVICLQDRCAHRYDKPNSLSIIC